MVKSKTRGHGPPILVLALLTLSPTVAPARADAPGPAPPLPRVALTLDGASVVVIAAHKKLYAFLDGIDDNAPLRGAEMQIAAQRTVLPLQEMSPGIYVSGTFNPPAVRTPLTVSVTRAGQTARGTADLILPDVPETAAAPSRLWLRLLVLAALAGGVLGVVRYLRPGAAWWWPGRAA